MSNASRLKKFLKLSSSFERRSFTSNLKWLLHPHHQHHHHHQHHRHLLNGCRVLPLFHHQQIWREYLHTGNGDKHPGNGDKGGKKGGQNGGNKNGWSGRYTAGAGVTKGPPGGGEKRQQLLTAGKSEASEPDGKYTTVSPTTIQVYSDPTLSRTVRELSVVLQRVRNQVKGVKEDAEDCAFELVKQGQNQRAADKLLKEAAKHLEDVTKRQDSSAKELRVMERNLVFFSKMSASHDNQIRDSILRLNECERRLDAAIGRLDYIGSSLQNLKRMVHEDIRSDLRELKLEIKMGKNETRNLRTCMVREGLCVESTPARETCSSVMADLVKIDSVSDEDILDRDKSGLVKHD